MKINIKRSNLLFWKQFAIKMTQLLFLWCVLLFACFSSHLEAVLSSLRFRVVLTIKNKGRLASLKPTVPTRSSINPIKMINSQKLPLKDQLMICLPLHSSWISGFTKTTREALDFRLFSSEFSFWRCVWPGKWTWRNQWSLKVTSQRQFASLRKRARCIASSTVGGSLGPFDWQHQRNLTRQNITRVAALFTQLKQHTEQSSSIDLAAWKKTFYFPHFTFTFKTSEVFKTNLLRTTYLILFSFCVRTLFDIFILEGNKQ